MGEYRTPELIAAKRDGGELDAEQLAWLVEGYLSGVRGAPGAPVSEGQMAALLMAGVLQGFTEAEALALTRILVDSGEVLDLSALAGPTVDKHSTGGVGDTTTLLVAPLIAEAGAQLVKLAGRGLGHTGGTIDKLASIPGLRTELTPDELRRIAADVGCVVAAQTGRLVPADRALYALRDETATVPSTGLIAASVMAKKLAAGAGHIVLDVKAGGGAFAATAAQAEVLAQLCVRIGVGAGRRCAALVTGMDQPLGRAVGNALEVAEAVRVLSRPPSGRLAEVALELAASAVALAREGSVEPRTAVRAELEQRWAEGRALERLGRMIGALGGDPAVCEQPAAVLPRAPVVGEVTAQRAGYIAALPARPLGLLVAGLGAGRSHKGADIDPAVGIVLDVELGAEVAPDSVVATIHARSSDELDAAAEQLRGLLSIADEPPPPAPPILQVVA